MIKTQKEYELNKKGLNEMYQLREEMLECTSLNGDAKIRNIDTAIVVLKRKLSEYESRVPQS
ncbi:hypothetical protein DZF79_29005 [Vibrio parahaemolyticus]|nr:hypothetical protein [Vibrio parahaemolyticus]